MDRPTSGTTSRRSRGSSLGWLLFTLLSGTVAILVVVFIRNLPDPPRYDALTIDPGSEVPSRSPFGMRMEVGEGEAMITRSWRTTELKIVGKPMLPEVLARGVKVGDSWRLVAALNVELSEPTVVGLVFEGRDVEFTIRSDVSEIASHRIEESEVRRIDDFLIPAGSRDLEIDIVPVGSDPMFHGMWIDEAGVQRPLSELAGFESSSPP